MEGEEIKKVKKNEKEVKEHKNKIFKKLFIGSLLK